MLCSEWFRVFLWFTIPLVFFQFSDTVPSVPITAGITVTFHFPSIVCWNGKIHETTSLLINTTSALLVWFGLVGLGFVWFGWVLWHINHCRLFNAKSSLYIYIIKYIWFGLVGFYGISTIVGYLTPNPLYTYILNIYDLVWLGFMAYQPL